MSPNASRILQIHMSTNSQNFFHQERLLSCSPTFSLHSDTPLVPTVKTLSNLLPANNHRTPQFYGLPKLHKEFTHIHVPPIRPIVSYTNSLLSHTAAFIDRVLQPLACSYHDYLHNSTSLINQLESFSVPTDAVLVSADVDSLYPLIPQTMSIQITYAEMCSHKDLLLFDPNLIIQLLHLSVNSNHFEFAGFTFHQVQGTAMGAAFPQRLLIPSCLSSSETF